MIKVYDSTERLFNHNGIKILKPTKAIIYKEDNGDYYLEIEDSIENIKYYQQGNIIRVSTPWEEQGFRLNNPKIKNNKIQIKAWHIYYDSRNYLIEDSYVVDKKCNDALDHLNIACDQATPFSTLSNINTINSYRCVRKSFEEAISIVIERWGGHLVRDNFNISILDKIGNDNGIVLSYSKNIKEIKKEENWDNVVTKLLPTGKDGIMLDEIYLESDIKYDTPYTKTVSFDQNIEEEDFSTEEEYKQALKEDLKNQALQYLENNKFPLINYELDAHLEEVTDVGDTIYVQHPKCNIDITTNIISVEYDCIKQRYKSIEFGNFKKTLSNLLTTTKEQANQIVEEKTTIVKVTLGDELKEATSKIWNVLGNSYIIYDGDKILIVDKIPKESAKNVIMINSAGIGFSQTGINGIFNSAWLIDGTLDMQKINVINLVADMIKGGTLKLGSTLNEKGVLEIYNETNTLIGLLDKNGVTIYDANGGYVKMNPEVGFAGYDSNGQKTYWASGDEFHQKKSVVEEEITISNKVRVIPITVRDENNKITNDGIGFLALV